MITGQHDLVKKIAELLNKYRIDYLLTGSLAVSYYGYPRATHDIDFVLEISAKDSGKVLKLTEDLGESFLVDKDQIKKAIAKSSQFNFYHLGTGVKIDFWVSEKNEFEQSKFKRRKKIFIDGQPINFISQEDLLLTKLLWCKEVESERHLRDCAGILKIQEKNLDMEYLHLWVKRLKVEELFSKIQTLDYSSF